MPKCSDILLLFLLKYFFTLTRQKLNAFSFTGIFVQKCIIL